MRPQKKEQNIPTTSTPKKRNQPKPKLGKEELIQPCENVQNCQDENTLNDGMKVVKVSLRTFVKGCSKIDERLKTLKEKQDQASVTKLTKMERKLKSKEESIETDIQVMAIEGKNVKQELKTNIKFQEKLAKVLKHKELVERNRPRRDSDEEYDYLKDVKNVRHYLEKETRFDEKTKKEFYQHEGSNAYIFDPHELIKQAKKGRGQNEEIVNHVKTWVQIMRSKDKEWKIKRGQVLYKILNYCIFVMNQLVTETWNVANLHYLRLLAENEHASTEKEKKLLPKPNKEFFKRIMLLLGVNNVSDRSENLYDPDLADTLDMYDKNCNIRERLPKVNRDYMGDLLETKSKEMETAAESHLKRNLFRRFVKYLKGINPRIDRIKPYFPDFPGCHEDLKMFYTLASHNFSTNQVQEFETKVTQYAKNRSNRIENYHKQREEEVNKMKAGPEKTRLMKIINNRKNKAKNTPADEVKIGKNTAWEYDIFYENMINFYYKIMKKGKEDYDRWKKQQQDKDKTEQCDKLDVDKTTPSSTSKTTPTPGSKTTPPQIDIDKTFDDGDKLAFSEHKEEKKRTNTGQLFSLLPNNSTWNVQYMNFSITAMQNILKGSGFYSAETLKNEFKKPKEEDENKNASKLEKKRLAKKSLDVQTPGDFIMQEFFNTNIKSLSKNCHRIKGCLATNGEKIIETELSMSEKVKFSSFATDGKAVSVIFSKLENEPKAHEKKQSLRHKRRGKSLRQREKDCARRFGGN